MSRLTNLAQLPTLGILNLTGQYGLIWTLHGWVFEVQRIEVLD